MASTKVKSRQRRNILQQRLAKTATQKQLSMQNYNHIKIEEDEKGGTQDVHVDELQQQIEQQREEELQVLKSAGGHRQIEVLRDGDIAGGVVKRRAIAVSQSSLSIMTAAKEEKANNIDDDIENQSPSKSKPRRVYRRSTIEKSVSMLQSMYRHPTIVKVCKVSISRRYMLILKYFGIVSLVIYALQLVKLNLPTRYDVNSATHALMNDQLLLNSFEEEAGLKFIHEDQYTSMNNELNVLSNRVNQLNTELEDVSMIQSMIDTLGLSGYCPQCMFSVRRNLSCIGRVNMLRSKQISKYKAILSVMQTKSCRRSKDSIMGSDSKPGLVDMNRSDDKIDVIKQQPQGDKKNLELRERAEATEIDIIVKDWNKYQADFCHNCYIESMASSTTNKPKLCIEEASRMLKVDRQKTIASIAKAKVVVRFPRCRLSWYNEQMRKMHKNKNESFCGGCLIGEKDTGVRCAQHMQTLVSMRKIESHVALFETMENEEVCTKRVGV